MTRFRFHSISAGARRFRPPLALTADHPRADVDYRLPAHAFDPIEQLEEVGAKHRLSPGVALPIGKRRRVLPHARLLDLTYEPLHGTDPEEGIREIAL